MIIISLAVIISLLHRSLFCLDVLPVYSKPNLSNYFNFPSITSIQQFFNLRSYKFYNAQFLRNVFLDRYKSDIQALNLQLLFHSILSNASHPRCNIHISSLEQAPRNNLILTHVFILEGKRKNICHEQPVFSMERSLIKFKRQSLEKILIFSAKTNVFPPRGQDMSDIGRGGRALCTRKDVAKRFVRSGSRAST